MTIERQQRIYHLLDIALKLELPARRAYLDQACSDDTTLRREVESLLVAEEQAAASGFLDTPAPVKFAGVLAQNQEAKAMSDQPMILNGRYLIPDPKKPFNEGGFGAVYQAHDLNLHSRLVVVKVLKLTNDPDTDKYMKEKFHGDIDALSRFRHPHIVGILDQGTLPESGDPFFVMDLIEGESLRAAMQSGQSGQSGQHGRLDFARSARILQQAAHALSYAHEHGVYHRDLKPDNIMLRRADDSVVIIDFGIATVHPWPHATRGIASAPKTKLVGTPEYMAPEQIRGEPSHKSDIWALGVIVYKMLTGQLPFDVPPLKDRQWSRKLYEMQRAGVLVKPKQLRSDLPDAAQAAILQALAFDPAARYEQARDFGDALAKALMSEQGSASSFSPTEVITPGVPSDAPTPSPIIRVKPDSTEVVISYDSHDFSHAHQIANHLRAAGINCWMAGHRREALLNDRSETGQAIEHCKIILLLCSDAALHSRIVKEEMQLAWKYERPFVPLLVEPTDFKEQVEYWLEGKQRIEVMNLPSEQWLPLIFRALANVGVRCPGVKPSTLEKVPITQPIQLDHSLKSLRLVAGLTTKIWPLPAERRPNSAARSAVRGLGAPQEDVQHGHRLGSRVCLSIESDREGHLLLLDEGPEGILYCLCPSQFAPDTCLREGRNDLPQERSRYDSFVVTGKSGREHLLAIVSDETLGMNWLPSDPKIPARVLKQADIDALLALLRRLEAGKWTALSTYFDVII